MRILYVTTYSPWPPVSGGAWRSFRILERLAANHAVVVALCADEVAVRQPFLANNPLGLETRVLDGTRAPTAVVDGSPRALGLDYTPTALRKRWRRAFLETCSRAEPDLVWLSELSSAWRCGPMLDVPVVTDMVDIQAVKEARAQAAELGVPASELVPEIARKELLLQPDLRRRYLLRRASLRVGVEENGLRRRRAEATVLQVALAECSVARASSSVILANEDDAPFIGALAPTVVVPNGFDFPSNPDRGAERAGTTLVFFGLLTYRPNLDGLRWFCERVWPLVRAEEPTARLAIVGAHDERLSFASAVAGATVHGFVPDLTTIVDRSAALVVPLLAGGGTRIKILEAWARLLPVVSTSIGCEGLGARDGANLLVADDPAEFAERCLRVLGDPVLGRRLAREGFEYGRRRYDWSVTLAGLEDALEVARSEFSRRRARRRDRGPVARRARVRRES